MRLNAFASKIPHKTSHGEYTTLQLAHNQMSSTTPKKKQRIQVFDGDDEKKREEMMINPYTNQPYSQTYLNILETRRKLPVWKQKSDFLHQLAASQTLVLVGETGSGKTTQIPQYLCEAGYCNDGKMVCSLRSSAALHRLPSVSSQACH